MTDLALTSTPLLTADGVPLKNRLRRIERLHQLKSILLILPLILFLMLTFIAPLVAMLGRSVENPEVPKAFPQTIQGLAQ